MVTDLRTGELSGCPLCSGRELNWPLDGLRAIDFPRVLADPFCTALLGDLDTEIIMAESSHGDDYRHVGARKSGESAIYTTMNRNKKSLALALKKPEVISLVPQLVAQSDVVVVRGARIM